MSKNKRISCLLNGALAQQVLDHIVAAYNATLSSNNKYKLKTQSVPVIAARCRLVYKKSSSASSMCLDTFSSCLQTNLIIPVDSALWHMSDTTQHSTRIYNLNRNVHLNLELKVKLKL